MYLALCSITLDRTHFFPALALPLIPSLVHYITINILQFLNGDTRFSFRCKHKIEFYSDNVIVVWIFEKC